MSYTDTMLECVALTKHLLSMLIKAKGHTHVGRVRSTNQDSLLVDNANKLYIVADGMGGHAGGEIASSLCTEVVEQHIVAHLTKDFLASKIRHDRVCSALSEAVNQASSAIYKMSVENPAIYGMGTTASILLILKDHAYVAHVGDSRVFLIREKLIYQLTEDHSLVNENLKTGVIKAKETKTCGYNNIITRCVGYQMIEEVDTHVFPIEDNDLYVLSSDGLHGAISDQEISNNVHEKKLNSIEGLIKLANNRGGEDNITVIVVSIERGDN